MKTSPYQVSACEAMAMSNFRDVLDGCGHSPSASRELFHLSCFLCLLLTSTFHSLMNVINEKPAKFDFGSSELAHRINLPRCTISS